MNVGREEQRLAGALRERGIDTVPQCRVSRGDELGHFYDIDLACWPLQRRGDDRPYEVKAERR